MNSLLLESALILVCPEVEYAVAPQRERYDRAAKDGIPAHVTAIYPFTPPTLLTADDHGRLKGIADQTETFSVHLNRTGWFGDSVVYLLPDDPAPIALLTHRIFSAFPDFPPYGGKFSDLTPHLTIGHDQSAPALKAAEKSVIQRLPLIQVVDHLELWAGQAVEGRTEPTPWRHIRDYTFGLPARP